MPKGGLLWVVPKLPPSPLIGRNADCVCAPIPPWIRLSYWNDPITEVYALEEEINHLNGPRCFHLPPISGYIYGTEIAIANSKSHLLYISC